MYNVWQIVHLYTIYTYIWPDLQGFNTMKFKIFKVFQGGIVLSRKDDIKLLSYLVILHGTGFEGVKIKGDNMFLAKFWMDFDFHHKIFSQKPVPCTSLFRRIHDPEGMGPSDPSVSLLLAQSTWKEHTPKKTFTNRLQWDSFHSWRWLGGLVGVCSRGVLFHFPGSLAFFVVSFLWEEGLQVDWLLHVDTVIWVSPPSQ